MFFRQEGGGGGPLDLYDSSSFSGSKITKKTRVRIAAVNVWPSSFSNGMQSATEGGHGR